MSAELSEISEHQLRENVKISNTVLLPDSTKDMLRDYFNGVEGADIAYLNFCNSLSKRNK